MKRIALAVIVPLLFVGTASAQEFKLGFKALADQIHEVAGTPIENEWHNAVNGDALQRTTTGMMAWRKSDNHTLFTNGHMSWVNGPLGMQSRLNTERFEWEMGVSTPTASSALPVIGETAIKDGVSFRVNSMSTPERIGYSILPQQGTRFIVLDISIENISRKEVHSWEFFLPLRTGDGHQFLFSGASLFLNGRLREVRLLPGQVNSGLLAYEVPVGISDIMAVFEHMGRGTADPIVIALK